MPPPPFCIHCSQPVHAHPDDPELLVHANMRVGCADGKNEAEVER